MTQLPPRQRLAAPGKWPVVGEKAPRAGAAPWMVTVAGSVENPTAWTLAELLARPRTTRPVDIHCVTRWSRRKVVFSGIPLAELLDAARPRADARFLSFVARSERGHSTSLPLADALALETLVVFEADGAPLETVHGGPVRTVVPGRYFYKSVKWLERIEVLAEDRLGYWEAEAGYHNHADPWAEERYIAPSVDPKTLARALAARDFSGLDLRGVDLRGRSLPGLNAAGAALRDAHFEGADLSGADFTGANLSNAHLEDANLTGASFRDADAEGAAFDGATLAGVNFAGARLFGATFAPDPRDVRE